MDHEQSGPTRQDVPHSEWCPGENEETLHELLGIFHKGDHRRYEREITTLLRRCKNPALKIRVADMLTDVKPDKINVLIGISTIALFLIIALIVIVPHGQVLVARQLVQSIETGDIARSRLLFTTEGWERMGGRELAEKMSGRKGRAFSPTSSGRKLDYLRIEFANRRGLVNQRQQGVKWDGLYLLFAKSGNQWRIGQVQEKKPIQSLTDRQREIRAQRQLRSKSHALEKDLPEAKHNSNATQVPVRNPAQALEHENGLKDEHKRGRGQELQSEDDAIRNEQPVTGSGGSVHGGN